MEEEAVITSVQSGPSKLIDESLALESLNVRFRVQRFSKHQEKVVRATIKSPSWLSDLQASAPLKGYVVEQGEFFASLPKDDRIKEGLKVTVEVAES
jgi:hypothetical protein